jgi:Fibronectin type III domain
MNNTLGVILFGAALFVPYFNQAADTPAIEPAPSTVTLSWGKSPSRDVKGYRLHYGTTPKRYSETIDVGNVTTYTITNLIPRKRYYFVVTAYNATGNESLPSNERPFYITAPVLHR